MRLVPALICFGVLLAADAAPADAASENSGQDLAKAYCGACHRVSSQDPAKSKLLLDTGGGMQEYDVPSFRQIAVRPGRDATYLHTSIMAPHYPMPEQQFLPDELEQIVGYILSLKAEAGDW